MTIRAIIFTMIAAAACALCPLDTRAATSTINPSADAFVSSVSAGNNYGSAGALSVSPSGSTKGKLDSYIRFNLASTKTYFDGIYGAGNWTVQSITLQLTTTSPNNAVFNNPNVAGTFSVTSLQSGTADSWVEGTGTPAANDTTTPNALTYNNHSNYLDSTTDKGAGTFSFTGGTSGALTYTLTLSGALVANVQAGSDTNFYLSAVDAMGMATGVAYTFNSNINTTASTHPVLTVTVVPEPGTTTTLTLAGCLLTRALAARRRRA